MNRITVEMVKEAVEKTGLKVVRGLTIDLESKCGCPIGILAAATIGPELADAMNDPDDLAITMGLDAHYSGWFYAIFDDPEAAKTEQGFLKGDPCFEMAKEDGVACRKAFIEG